MRGSLPVRIVQNAPFRARPATMAATKITVHIGGSASVLLRPRASLSVTLKIEVARVHLRTGSCATGLSEPPSVTAGSLCPVQRLAIDGYIVLDLARCTRQKRTLTPSAAMHKYTGAAPASRAITGG
jgi:hypothetical protein